MRLTAAAALGFVLLDAGAAYAHHHPRLPDGLRDASTPIPGLEADAYARGKALLGLNDVPGALAAFRSALAQSPQSTDALNGVAVAYDRMGRADLARAYYEAGLAIDPHSPTLLNNFGYSRYLAGDLAAAIDPLRAAAASGEPSVVAAANRTLAMIAARPSEVRVAVAVAEDSGSASHIEQTNEGEQRLVFDAPAPSRALASSLGDDARLIAVAKPWTEHDDVALAQTTQAQDTAAANAELAETRATKLADAHVAAPIKRAPLADPGAAKLPPVPTLAAALEVLATRAVGTSAPPPLRAGADDGLASHVPGRAELAFVRSGTVGNRARGRPRTIMAKHPETQGALAFESDDVQLNAFADRMRRRTSKPFTRPDDLETFAERVRRA